jgi:hypothetical protein
MYEREEEWAKAAVAYKTIQEKFYVEYQKMGVDKFLEKALIKENK